MARTGASTRAARGAPVWRKLPHMRKALLAAWILSLAACGPPDLSRTRPVLVVEPEELDFGERPVLNDLALKVKLSNFGSAPLLLQSIHIDGDDDGAFFLEAIPEEVVRGHHEDVHVVFLPREMKSYDAVLVIESNDEDQPRVEIPLTGEGSTAATASVEPLALDFGRVGENRSSVRLVRITSVGSAPLKIQSIGFAEGSSAAYGFVGSTRTPQEIRSREGGMPDAFVEVTVRFSPTADALGTEGVLVLETTDPDQQRLEIPLTATVNRQPVAVPGEDVRVPPGAEVVLDGSESYDPDGDDPIAYRWELIQAPVGSTATLEDDTTATPSLVPDLPGAYLVQLVVTDAAGLSSKGERVTVSGVTSEGLQIELVWDHDRADLDLHFSKAGAELHGPDDCNGWSCEPSFGLPGDPIHSGDKLSGFGPERVTWTEPVDGTYDIRVRYVSALGASNLTVPATVRVRLYGTVARELHFNLTQPEQVWKAGTIHWPSGQVTP